METELVYLGNQSQQNEASSDHVVSIVAEEDRKWFASMEEKIKAVPKLLKKSAGNSSCCIFRVPQSLVEINEKAYRPHIVSIGPYHHGKPHLLMIEEHKWRFLGRVLARTKNHGVCLDDFLKAIASMEEQIREHYSETVEYSSHDLIEMMMLDGCFIIELFCVVGKVVESDVDDPIFNMSWMFSFLMRDLLRLENQIPFVVLRTLFELSILTLGKNDVPSLKELILGFFDYAIERPLEVLCKYNILNAKHLLDLFRSTFIPPSEAVLRRTNNSYLQMIQSAKQLHLSGIKFKPRETAESFLDIKFRNGILEIPPLTIDDFTSCVLLNCVAFEQCYNHCSKHFTSYLALMSCLINTMSDAGLLRDCKILENYLGTDEEVARFFNILGKDVVFDIQRSYLQEVFADVNRHYRSNWHVRWAGFKHTYFDSPWSFMSAVAALMLLILTMIQAFFAVYGYIHPLN